MKPNFINMKTVFFKYREYKDLKNTQKPERYISTSDITF